MAKGQRISPLIVQEALASGDDRFLDLLHQLGAASGALVAKRLGLDRSTVSRRLAEIRALLGGRERS